MRLVENKPAVSSIGQIISEYRKSNLASGKSPATIRWYNDLLHQFHKYITAKYSTEDVSSLTIGVARDYILHLSQKPKYRGHPYTPEQTVLLSPRTIQCHVRAMKAFSTWLYREGYLPVNRLQQLKLPKAPIRMVEPLAPGEINKIAACIRNGPSAGARNHAILVTLLDTGLRASEIASITLGNLNLHDGCIRVMGKGAKERIVPLGKYTRTVLWSYIDKVRSVAGEPGCDSLFLSAGGKPITVNTIKLMFTRLAKSSGIERLHAHLCRHTFAINYLLNGGDIFSLKEILGHSSLEMVNHYLHFTSAQITAQQHKYSPMDRLMGEQKLRV